jgi:UPF0755 protein
MRFFRRLLLLLVLILAGAGAALFLLEEDYAGFTKEVFVDIPKGCGALAMGRLLADAGVVRSRWLFLLERALRPRTKLQAGEYLFSAPSPVSRVFGRIAKGDIFYYELVVPEGANIFDIAASLDKLAVISSRDFLNEAQDPALIHDLAPQAPTLEGYLFPDTYHITRHNTAAQLCRQMTEQFREEWELLRGADDANAVVTLASLVEKETARPEERPLIASVFENRRQRGMPLDCDPTAIYAALLEKRYHGAIHKSDLENKNAYNTYQHAGLPPGPIANPGIESLRAALHPAQSGYLYFVAKPDGSGSHEFSRTLEEHNRAVQRYRRGEKQPIETTSARKIHRRKKSRARRGA